MTSTNKVVANAMRFDAPLSADIKKRMDAESIGPMGLQKVANAEEPVVKNSSCDAVLDFKDEGILSSCEHWLEYAGYWVKHGSMGSGTCKKFYDMVKDVVAFYKSNKDRMLKEAF